MLAEWVAGSIVVSLRDVAEAMRRGRRARARLTAAFAGAHSQCAGM